MAEYTQSYCFMIFYSSFCLCVKDNNTRIEIRHKRRSQKQNEKTEIDQWKKHRWQFFFMLLSFFLYSKHHIINHPDINLIEEMKSLPACSPHYPWRKLLLFTELQRKEPAFPESQRQMRARDRDRLKTSRLLLRRGGEGRLLPHLQKSRRVFPLSIHTRDTTQTPSNPCFMGFLSY